MINLNPVWCQIFVGTYFLVLPIAIWVYLESPIFATAFYWGSLGMLQLLMRYQRVLFSDTSLACLLLGGIELIIFCAFWK